MNERSDPETPAIAALVEDYFLGMHEGDLERLRGVFNPQCQLFGEDGEGSHELILADFLAFIESGPTPKAEGEPFDMRLVSVDRTSSVGMAKAEARFRGRRYTDYLMLHKTDAGWSIVGKAFFSPDA